MVKKELVEKKKKKRGRKPKLKTAKDLLPKEKKKRGRKPKNTVKKEEKKPLADLKKRTDNIILYLPVHSEQINNDFVEDQFLTYDPEIPSSPRGVESSKFDIYETTKENVTKMERHATKEVDIDVEISNIEVDSNKSIESKLFKGDKLDIEFGSMISNIHKCKKVAEKNNIEKVNTKPETHSNLMDEFKESNKTKQWPSKTNIYCFWCVFPFNNTPCAIPEKYIDGTFYVSGCFCSPECAAAHIFNNSSSDNVWEQYTLLNLLYKDIYGSNRIKIALPRNVLQIFGGYMTIDEFRSFHNNKYKEATMIMPPLYSVIPQIEENYIEKSAKKKRFVPIDLEKVKRAKENLRLKRSKPIQKYKNTLENCMNLTYV